ncbi:MAG: 5'/3'-nucleotidase SurE [Desulfobacterales bacterium]|nr:5'/3'-nucleotidase SurE [Desulfobacterales bacterium]
MKHPKIMITNDDGIHSPGLRAAAQAAMNLGQVIVVAPSKQQTGSGRSMKGYKESSFTPVDYEINGEKIAAFHCDCSPALAVHHGLNVLCPHEKPDLIISGINYGENMGINITVSGTVGAALEGASKGIPALAVSLQTEVDTYHEYTDQNWTGASHFLSFFARLLLSGNLPPDVDALKIDVPDNATALTPWRLTRLSRQVYYLTHIEQPSRESKIGDTKLRINKDQASFEKESDIYALTVERVVSVTPLSLDLTSRTDFRDIRNLLTGSCEPSEDCSDPKYYSRSN